MDGIAKPPQKAKRDRERDLGFYLEIGNLVCSALAQIELQKMAWN